MSESGFLSASSSTHHYYTHLLHKKVEITSIKLDFFILKLSKKVYATKKYREMGTFYLLQ